MLQDKTAPKPIAVVSYRGADTPASFGDSSGEFRSLLEACGLYDMSWQAKLVLTGEDRVRWLNGMVTNNVRSPLINVGTLCLLPPTARRCRRSLRCSIATSSWTM